MNSSISQELSGRVRLPGDFRLPGDRERSRVRASERSAVAQLLRTEYASPCRSRATASPHAAPADPVRRTGTREPSNVYTSCIPGGGPLSVACSSCTHCSEHCSESDSTSRGHHKVLSVAARSSLRSRVREPNTLRVNRARFTGGGLQSVMHTRPPFGAQVASFRHRNGVDSILEPELHTRKCKLGGTRR